MYKKAERWHTSVYLEIQPRKKEHGVFFPLVNERLHRVPTVVGMRINNGGFLLHKKRWITKLFTAS